MECQCDQMTMNGSFNQDIDEMFFSHHTLTGVLTVSHNLPFHFKLHTDTDKDECLPCSLSVCTK